MSFDKLINFIKNYWFWFALGESIFFGIRSACLFENNYEKKYEKFFWKSYQFIFNFVGSFLGWICFYVLIYRLTNQSFNIIEVEDFVLFFISLLGLTGHLPQSIYGILGCLNNLSEIILKKIEK